MYFLYIADAISSIKKLALDERSIKKLYTEILEIPALRGRFRDITSAEVLAPLIFLIFGDNAGEIVFDKLLIEIIRQTSQPEIIFVVGSVPTLNDATLQETKSIGLDKIVTVIENGIDGPLPGTILSRCLSQVNDLVRQSDLIISKGGGNFDTIDEERKRLN